VVDDGVVKFLVKFGILFFHLSHSTHQVGFLSSHTWNPTVVTPFSFVQISPCSFVVSNTLKYISSARCEVFTTVKIQVKVFWVVMLCIIVVGYDHFRGPCSLHLQAEDGCSIEL
jgi:hypothetical protein